ncbi:3-hydroxyisobutyryl-CoA hydrolase 1-like [Senna tora]|uniref:3-hydroxyisobutyryl-CoA hydrolase n=1 Tax=Senna tora TaxID=362788 RepID=A0A834XGH7_9FABA|nr:3-hydroxyisobutyryl-CoA hydrolase 1-like [Senna tora]
MPETALGLFPDVGASYFLSRLPGYFGEYVGLTGARLDGAELLACGLATHFVCSSKLSSLEEDLCKVESNDPTAVTAIIDRYSEQPILKEGCAYGRCAFRMASIVPLHSLYKDYKTGKYSSSLPLFSAIGAKVFIETFAICTAFEV